MLSLITDRTLLDVLNKTDKGFYNVSDLNRVGEATKYLADLLNSYGYSVTVNPKTDWFAGDNSTEADIPTTTQMAQYLADLNAIKAVFYGTVDLPAAMDNAGYEDANNIEKLLLEIETLINRMVAGYRKCGTFKSGQGVILP